MVRAVLFVGDCRSVMTRVGFCLMYVVFLITVRPSDQRNLNTLLGFCFPHSIQLTSCMVELRQMARNGIPMKVARKAFMQFLRKCDTISTDM